MAGTQRFTIGTEVACTDEVCGDLSRVVIDPLTRAVTHLVIMPRRGARPARLVPVDLVDASAGSLRLTCSSAEFDALAPAEETHFLPDESGYEGYGPGQVMSWPYYGLGGAMGVGLMHVTPSVTYDKLPLGEVAIQRGEHVHATDGEIGRIQGLVMDRTDHHVTHVLLQEGHLWGRKQVAIPIGAVAGVTSGIHLTITKHQVQDLPPIEIDSSPPASRPGPS